VRTRPHDLDDSDLADLLGRHWGFDAADLVYAPVGFGSHHWLATEPTGRRRFVTVDDLRARGPGGPVAALAKLTAAMVTAHTLRHVAGLPFVVSPTPADDGHVVQPMGESFAVAVFPHVDGCSWPGADDATAADRAQVVGLLARLHAATPSVSTFAGVDPLRVPARAGLQQALTELGAPWTSGPNAEPARELLVAGKDDLLVLLSEYDHRVDALRGRGEPWVVTHGETHAQNLLATADGPVLLDWDTALVAPAARDLWMVESGSGEELSRYAELTGRQVDPDDLATYRLWWDLCEVAEYVRWFRAPHTRTADTEIAWGGLAGTMRVRERWPELF
jgi:spectinomycin phosphotransferase